MFGFKFTAKPETKNVEKAADKAIYRSIRHAAFSIRKAIRESIKKSPDPAAPGQPVTTRGRRGNVRNAIFAAVEEDSAVVGPRYSMVGDVVAAHEFGQTRYGDRYQARPTAGPALEANLDRFADSFAGSIGE
jgi:ApbE superfamily uncharacterized protein (UPF0280 family)